MEAIDKLRKITLWANYQSESFNYKLKSVADLEKIYDYCANSKNVEFLDDLSFLDKEERKTVKEEVTKLLGYSIF